MKKKYYNIFLFFLVLFISSAYGQLKETSLDNNVLLQGKKNLTKNIQVVDTLELPFFDDFTQNSIYPSNKFWLDSNVFLNNSFADTPIFKGVVTFDCLDKDGHIYSQANSFTFIADTLVSKPINLDYPPESNIFISFFVQPQGLAYDPPETRDSLVLKIKAPGTNWKSVWNMTGDTSCPFKQVLIPITDTAYLKKGFQMQFLNYASVSSDNRSSNGDYWNLDLVRIDTGMSVNDTTINDIGFVTTPKSYLKDYYAIPATHMNTNFDNKSNIQSYRNYGDSTIGFDRNLYFKVPDFETYPDSIRNIGGTVDMYPHSYVVHDFVYTATIFNPIFFNGKDTVEVAIRSVLNLNSNVPEEYRRNDTAYFTQKFYNYYALDDGVPEAGIGIDGIESAGAMLAVKFYTIKPDTLRSIRYWFNRVNGSSNLDLAFDMLVWDNDDGRPGNIIYEEDGLLTKYGYGLDNYVDYMLKEPFLLEDTFFIGFRQNHEIYMNLGFDKNYDNNERTFYSFGTWQQSVNKGTIMIRPVFGEKFSVGINNPKEITDNINIYPNPATNVVNIDMENEFVLKIYNQIGKLVDTFYNKNIIDVSNYTEGLYFLNINSADKSFTRKLIINR